MSAFRKEEQKDTTLVRISFGESDMIKTKMFSDMSINIQNSFGWDVYIEYVSYAECYKTVAYNHLLYFPNRYVTVFNSTSVRHTDLRLTKGVVTSNATSCSSQGRSASSCMHPRNKQYYNA